MRPPQKRQTRLASRTAGARLHFLPPHSPDFNPIERVFAKLKHPLRKAKERAADATWQRIGAILISFQPEECPNHFRYAGYGAVLNEKLQAWAMPRHRASYAVAT